MLAVGLRPLPRAASSSSSLETPDAGDAGDGMFAGGEGAGLVEQHGVDRAHPFEREAVLDEDPGPGAHRGRDRDHERDGQPERVRAGDDEHRDGAARPPVVSPSSIHTTNVTTADAVAT